MSNYKKKTVEKINQEETKYQSYCLICQKVHKLDSTCNKAISLFVKHHTTKMYNIANKEQKLQLIKIIQDSRTELLSKIGTEMPEFIKDYIDNNDDTKSLHTPMISK